MKTYTEVMLNAGIPAEHIEPLINVAMDVMESDSLDYHEFGENVVLVAHNDGYYLENYHGLQLAKVANYSWLTRAEEMRAMKDRPDEVITTVTITQLSRTIDVQVTYSYFCGVYFVQAYIDGMHFGCSDTSRENVFDAMSEAKAIAESWALREESTDGEVTGDSTFFRTTFGLLAIGRVFNFIGNPITFRKVSDFTAEIIDSPYNELDEPEFCSVLDNQFGTDAIIDFGSESHLYYERISKCV